MAGRSMPELRMQNAGNQAKELPIPVIRSLDRAGREHAVVPCAVAKCAAFGSR
jgi:hypothetical protein